MELVLYLFRGHQIPFFIQKKKSSKEHLVRFEPDSIVTVHKNREFNPLEVLSITVSSFQFGSVKRSEAT